MIIKIGAKVRKAYLHTVQSKRNGSFFFLAFEYDFERENLLTQYSFLSVLSVHHHLYGHEIRWVL